MDFIAQKVHLLEKEREDTAQEFSAQMNEMVAREGLAKRKIAEQQREIGELVQELHGSTNITIAYYYSAEGKPRGGPKPL